MSSPEKNVVLFALARNCPHCNEFKKGHIDNVKRWINTTGNLRLVIIDRANFQAKWTPEEEGKVPSQIVGAMRGYPSFFLVNGKDWDTSLKAKRDGHDNVQVNFEMMSMKYVRNENESNGIPAWIRSILASGQINIPKSTLGPRPTVSSLLPPPAVSRATELPFVPTESMKSKTCGGGLTVIPRRKR